MSRAWSRSYPVPLGQQVRTVLRVAVLRSIFASLRCGGFVLVGRRSAVRVGRGAAVHMSKGSVLIVGVEGDGSSGAVIRLRPRSTLSIDGRVQLLRGCVIRLNWGAQVSVGHGTFFNEGASVACESHVDIGAGCAISWDVLIMDSDVHRLVRSGREVERHQSVSVGDRCWIGARAVIAKGAQLAEGTVVGAGSVVTRNTSPRSLAVGVPARVVDHDIDWYP